MLFSTKEGLSQSINAAVAHRDTILDVVRDGKAVGKVMIYNGGQDALYAQKQTVAIVWAVAIAVQAIACVSYALYLDRAVIKPFRKLEGFAERVAGGNLDVPLAMDKRNLFGAFTESFDIMRSELKRARIAEAEANASKKELVAKLSHDIKTPVASIKAAAEVGCALSDDRRTRENYTQIVRKADQINTLVTNLFTATLEELRQLTVEPADLDSRELATMLGDADYLRRAKLPGIPECLVFADKLRLQQVFDNLFANSYKYAGTNIDVFAEKDGNRLKIIVEDYGGGVSAEELPLLKEKFRRGGNAKGTEGAGLGLFLSDYFMQEMGGELLLENGAHGLTATVCVRLSG